MSLVGTTAEIRSAHSGGADADLLEPGVGIMARGRHRFRFLEDVGRRCVAGQREFGRGRGLGGRAALDNRNG